MVFFTAIEPSKHYLEHHAHDLPWDEVVTIILRTKNPRKKGERFEIETENHYVLFMVEAQKVVVINAKRGRP